MGRRPGGRIGIEASVIAPQVSGIGERLRIFYTLDPRPVRVNGLHPSTGYRVTRFDPVTDQRSRLELLQTDAQGQLRLGAAASGHDEVVLMEQQDRKSTR